MASKKDTAGTSSGGIAVPRRVGDPTPPGPSGPFAPGTARGGAQVPTRIGGPRPPAKQPTGAQVPGLGPFTADELALLRRAGVSEQAIANFANSVKNDPALKQTILAQAAAAAAKQEASLGQGFYGRLGADELQQELTVDPHGGAYVGRGLGQTRAPRTATALDVVKEPFGQGYDVGHLQDQLVSSGWLVAGTFTRGQYDTETIYAYSGATQYALHAGKPLTEVLATHSGIEDLKKGNQISPFVAKPFEPVADKDLEDSIVTGLQHATGKADVKTVNALKAQYRELEKRRYEQSTSYERSAHYAVQYATAPGTAAGGAAAAATAGAASTTVPQAPTLESLPSPQSLAEHAEQNDPSAWAFRTAQAVYRIFGGSGA